MSSSPSAASSDSATAASSSGRGGSGSPTFLLQNLGNLGLGYAIAFALGFLVLLSTILLVSYVCCRSRRAAADQGRSGSGGPGSEGVIIPRIIFVAEDDEDERNGNGRSVAGLDQVVINSYPKFPFKLKAAAGGGADQSCLCSICLSEYKEGETLRMMPDCRHYFHLFCLDAWLRIHASCPVCRNSPLPTPVSTPLSELVPLSQYGDNRRR